MYKTYVITGLLAVILLGGTSIQSVRAETTGGTDVYATIKALTAQIAELQKQLAKLQTEVQTVLKDGLAEGMSDDDIAKIQELLATDSALYPEGKITGYFGPLTKEALKRFQKRHGLTEDGTLSKETRTLLEKYLKEKKGLSKSHVHTGEIKLIGKDGMSLTCLKDPDTNKVTCTNSKAAAAKEKNTETMEEYASDAITDAQEMIEKAQEAIEESDEDTEDAEEYVDEAEKKLIRAEEAFDDEVYEKAKMYAREALHFAEKALKTLE